MSRKAPGAAHKRAHSPGDAMSEQQIPTTAESLGQFRKELIEAGFNHVEASSLAMDWGRALVHEGTALRVGDIKPAQGASKAVQA
jgi:hypothetical protein